MNLKRRPVRGRTVLAFALAMSMLSVSISTVPTDVAGLSASDLETVWRLEVIDEGPGLGNLTTGIGVDPGGGVHVSYGGVDGGSLRCAHRPPDGPWETSTIAEGTGVGEESVLRVDGEGTVHVVYYDPVEKELVHASRNGDGPWDKEPVWQLTIPRANPSMTIDDGGTIHLVFTDQWNGELLYGIKVPGGPWSVEVINRTHPKSFGDTTIAVDAEGMAHVVWVYGSHFVHNASMVDGAWVAGKKAVATGQVTRLEMTIDCSGFRTVITSYEYLVKSLVWSPETGEWYENTPYHAELVHMWREGVMARNSRGLSVVCARSGSVGLSYYRTTDIHNHRYGMVNGSAEATATSIAAGPDGHFHIAYVDLDGSRLMYATDGNLPSAPKELKAMGGEVFVRITWERPDDLGNATEVIYTLYRGSQSVNLVPKLIEQGLTTTTYMDTDVERRRTYSYWVGAVNGAGEGHIAGPVLGVPSRIPTVPVNVTLTSGSDWIKVTWEPPGRTDGRDIVGYRVYWDFGLRWTPSWSASPYYHTPRSEGWNTTLEANVLSFNHTGLTRGYTLSYQVCALHHEGEGELAGPFYATAMEVPDPPTNLTHERTGGNVTLVWHHPEDDGGCMVTAYRIYRGTSEKDMHLIGSVDSPSSWTSWRLPTPTYRDTTRVNNQSHFSDDVRYLYAVSSVNFKGEGSLSEVVEARPLGVPSRPTNVSANLTSEGVRVNWTSPLSTGLSNISSYHVLRWTVGGEPELVGIVDDGSMSFLDNDLQSGTDYYYHVRAENRYGLGYVSETAYVHVPPDFAPEEDGVDDDTGRDRYFAVVVTIWVCVVVLLVLVLIARGRRT